MFAQRFLRFSRRAYSEAAVTATSAKKSRFDKSALKPLVSLLVFGSILTSVSAQQQKHADMVRRYEMKIRILQDLVNRSKKGDFNFDAEKELELVNKLFARHEKGKSVDLEREANMIREQASKQIIDRERVIKSMNSQLEDESLEDIFQDIMKDIDQPLKTVQAPTKKLDSSSMKQGSDDIIVDKEWIDYENQREQKRLAFKPSTEKHVIVESPGEYNTAAENTEVKRFL
ncbi:unnamed protein product [Kluyveromyces dobzhanskii CBS 2104]|uniref:WGS project CCBQ000000000 data, contig 00008 n=1 Tax=Kluyveromyces dobzhanskii CBS 2104 TaxID=1427455 RepID=A0A0A8L7M3_9SACH|nr:unnamed protein product [Kluyveromyces dobzhanskii CBS 2104]